MDPEFFFQFHYHLFGGLIFCVIWCILTLCQVKKWYMWLHKGTVGPWWRYALYRVPFLLHFELLCLYMYVYNVIISLKWPAGSWYFWSSVTEEKTKQSKAGARWTPALTGQLRSCYGLECEEMKWGNWIWQPCSQTQLRPRGVDGFSSHIRVWKAWKLNCCESCDLSGVKRTSFPAALGLRHALWHMKFTASCRHVNFRKRERSHKHTLCTLRL